VYGIESLDAETRAGAELIDLGCGTGESLHAAVERYGVAGIGVDRSERFVEVARERGLTAFQADILELRPDDLPGVKYVMLDNVLEHMPDLAAVEQVLAQSFRLASRCVHVRHPSFEDEEYLESLGLKLYWTDWIAPPNAHTCHARLHEFVEIANRLGVYRIRIEPVRRYHDSTHTEVLPLSAAPNQSYTVPQPRWDDTDNGVYFGLRHGPKPEVVFERPVYFAFDIFFLVGPGEPKLRYRHDPEVHAGRPYVEWIEPGAEASRDAVATGASASEA
jgi:SAM-dependent methyltransferase